MLDRVRSLMKKMPKQTFAVVFYSLFVVFLVFYIRSIDFENLRSMQFSVPYFLIACALGMGFRYWSTFVWVAILRSLGAKDVRLNFTLLGVYAKSWLGRYIPGSITWILGKIYFASEHGISKAKLAVSSTLEGLLQIVVQMVFAILLILIAPEARILGESVQVLLILGGLGGVFFVIPPVFNRILSLAYRVLGKGALPREHYARGGTVLRGASLYSFGAVLSGLSLFFIAKTVYPDLAYSSMLFVMGVSSLASAVSMLAVFAPGGIGVREGVQLLLLQMVLTPAVALAVTVFMRIWTLVLDLLFFALHARSASPRRAPVKGAHVGDV